MEVLTAYVRERAPWPPKNAWPLKDAITRLLGPVAAIGLLGQDEQELKEKQQGKNKRPLEAKDSSTLKPATDIQAVLTVLGRRNTWTPKVEESQRLDLSKTALQGADLKQAHLEGALLWQAHLEGAQRD